RREQRERRARRRGRADRRASFLGWRHDDKPAIVGLAIVIADRAQARHERCEAAALGVAAQHAAAIAARVQTRRNRFAVGWVALDIPLALPERRRIERRVARPGLEEQQDVFAAREARLIDHAQTFVADLASELLDDDFALGD